MDSSKRFVRQILLFRYKLLIDRICAVYQLSDEQRDVILKRILTLDWIDTGLESPEHE